MARTEPPSPEAISSGTDEEYLPPPRRRGRFRWILALLLLLVALLLSWAWIERIRLADSLIADQLAALDLPASYTVESISPQRQVLRHVVVGDPARPDLTVDTVVIELAARFGLPRIGRVTLVEPRIYASLRDGTLSLGTLDPLLFPEEEGEPFAMPAFDLMLNDARALLESDYGPVGFKAAGAGNLRGGFSGILAVAAPRLALEQCRAEEATLFGRIAIDAERPVFDGPLRIARLLCPESDLTLNRYEADITGRVDRTLDGFEGRFTLAGADSRFAFGEFASLGGEGRFSWRDRALTAEYDLALDDLDLGQLRAASLGAEGTLRGRDGFARLELDGTFAGEAIRPGPALDARLAETESLVAGSLLEPIARQLRAALRSEGQDSRLAADLIVRKIGTSVAGIVPNLTLRGSSGSSLLALSRFQLSSEDGGAPQISGGFSTGGRHLPRIAGRVERDSAGRSELRLRMSEYEAGGGLVAVPELVLAQGSDGVIDIAGGVVAGGALPGGSIEGLQLPLAGRWSPSGGLAMWNRCTTLRFDGLALSDLAIGRREVQLCPPPGSAILRSDGDGTRLAAGINDLELAGSLGGTPLTLTAEAVGFALPGVLTGKGVDVRLGEGEGVARFVLPDLTARLEGDLAGTFSGVEARLAAVPLDLSGAQGNWTYRDSVLALSEASLLLEDREQLDRFRPLVARDAELRLADGVITAALLLREPRSDRAVVRAAIRHDLASGLGGADLFVEGLRFDEGLQPEEVTPLALGVVANTRGQVDGRGRIDWSGESVTSTGRFGTDGLDFAAAFGPVKGVSGTIAFTDLLGMVTAPDQRIAMVSMNPGIEVQDGEISYQLLDGYVLQINGGNWPLLGGTLNLQPGRVELGDAPQRRFALELDGLDAARFIEHMELANLAATGTFDGIIPLMFDEAGGHIENGHLVARAPGGNLSYIGELTYSDLPVMGEFAFDALKSLDYREMEIVMNGSLDGEIVTSVRFDGIRQGEIASRNFLTEEIAKLPIQFNVNIRAPFYQLITTFRSMYDPAYIRDPRELGLIDSSGNRLTPVPAPDPVPELPALRPEDLPGDEAPVQTPESETAP